jgi:uncharacterized damage-inducible protein DinB
MKSFFKELFDYNLQMNNQLIERSLEFEAKVTERSQKLFSHILNAHEIWNTRILKQKSEFGVWQIHKVAEWKSINQAKFETSISIINDMGLDAKVSYSTNDGKVFENAVRDILFHIINHSTYHRGQIAADFRTNEIDPIVSDYILYKR